MNARRVPFEVPKERSRVCFGGFRPTKHVERPGALARGAPLLAFLGVFLLQFLTPLDSLVVYSGDEDNFLIGANPMRRPKVF